MPFIHLILMRQYSFRQHKLLSTKGQTLKQLSRTTLFHFPYGVPYKLLLHFPSQEDVKFSSLNGPL